MKAITIIIYKRMLGVVRVRGYGYRACGKSKETLSRTTCLAKANALDVGTRHAAVESVEHLRCLSLVIVAATAAVTRARHEAKDVHAMPTDIGCDQKRSRRIKGKHSHIRIVRAKVCNDAPRANVTHHHRALR